MGGGATPAIGTVHKIGCIQGAMLLGASGSWHFLQLCPANHWHAWFCLLLCVWPNLVGPFLAAATGASANAYDRSFSCSMTNPDYWTNLVVSINLQFARYILPAIMVIIFGAY